MDLLEIHNFLDFITGKERGAFFSPEEKDDVLDRAQWWLYNQEFDYYANNQELKDSLGVFSTKFQAMATSTGVVQLPVNYQHLLSMSTQYFNNHQQRVRYKPIKFLNEDEITERLDSTIEEPTLSDPVGEELRPGMFQLYPQQALSVTGYYLRIPQKPFFSYTLGADGRTITYNPVPSVQLEWDQSSLNKIIIKALQLAGVNISDQLIIQYTASKEQQDI